MYKAICDQLYVTSWPEKLHAWSYLHKIHLFILWYLAISYSVCANKNL